MRVVFFGTPEWSAVSLRALAASRHEVAAVVCAPDRPAGRSRAPRTCAVALEARGVGLAPILQPATLRPVEARSAILAARPDALVVVAYGRLLPGRLLDAPAHGAINVHFSLLPRHRGASPVQRTILDGDPVGGVTTMRMDRGLDTGPLLLTSSVAVGRRETACELGARLARLGSTLLLDTLDGLERGEIPARPQDDAGATLAPRLRKEDGHVRWGASAGHVDRMIRAFSRWPPVVARGPRGTLRLLAARPLAGPAADAAARGEPGCVLRVAGDAVDVACGGGSVLRVEALQPAGGRAMSAASAVAGRHLEVGGRLGDGPAS